MGVKDGIEQRTTGDGERRYRGRVLDAWIAAQPLPTETKNVAV